eukprot:g1221.t1
MSDRLRRAEEKVESALSDLESLLEFEEKVGHDLNASRKLRDTKKAKYDLLKKQCEDILWQDFGDDAAQAAVITDAEVQILVDHVKKFAREEHEEILAQIRDALRTNSTEERRNLLREISLEKRKANHPDAAPIDAATALTDDLDQLLADSAMMMTSPQLDDAAKEARTALLNLAKPLNKELKEFDRERWKEVVKQPRRRLQVFEAKSCDDDIYGVRAGLMPAPAPDEDLDFADGLGFGGGADRAGVKRDDPEDLGLGLGLGMDAAEAGPGADDALGATLTPKRAEGGGLSSPRLLGSSSPAADRPGGSGAGKVKSGGANAANKSASPKSAKQAPTTPKVGKSKAAPKPSSASSSSGSSSGPAVAGERAAAPKTPAKPATTPTSKGAKAKAATNPPGGARSSASSSATSPTAAAHKGSPTSFAKAKPPHPTPLPTTDEQKVIPFVEDLIDRLILPSVIAESLKKTLTQAEIEDKRKLHIKKLEQASGNANSPRGAGGKGLLSSPDEGVVKLTETELEAEAIPIIGTWIRDCAAREMWQLAQEMAQFNEEMQTLADYCIVTAALNPNAAGALHQAENWIEKPPADLSKFEQCVSVLSQMGFDMTKRKFRPSAPLDLDRRKTRMLTRAGSKEGVEVADGSSRAEDGAAAGEGGGGGADEKVATSKDDDTASATSFEEEVDVIPLKVADAPFYRVLNSKNRYSAKKAALLQASSANDAGPASNLNFANDPGLVDFYHAGGMGTTSFQLGAENLAAATSNVTAPDVASLGTSPTSGNTSLTNSPARLQNQFAARQAENATRAAVGDVGAQPPMVAASVGHGLGAEPMSPNSRRPRPHTFDPRKHGSWVEERRKFLRDRDPKTKEAISEFCSLDRNLRSTYTNGVDADANKGRISGFIAHVAVRYTRSLGLVLVLCTEKGYLGDNFLYVLRLPQKLPAPVVAGGSGGGGGTGVEGTADGEEADGSGGGEMNRGDSKNGNVNDLRARAGGAAVGNAVPSVLAQANAKKKSKKKSDPMGANVDWSDFFEPKFVLLRESVSEKKWHSPQLSADGSTVICLEGETGMAILCTSTFFQPEGFAANAPVPSSAAGSQTGYVHSMHKALAIDASIHFRRNGQEEYAEENLWPRKATFFQGDMSLLGTNETALVGLADGSLVKLNMGGKAVQVLPGAVDFGTPGIERLPRHAVATSRMSLPRRLRAEVKQGAPAWAQFLSMSMAELGRRAPVG